MCAEPAKIDAHLKSIRLIDGVPRSDAKTVNQLRADIEMRLRTARRKEAQSRRDAEALSERARNVSSEIRTIPVSRVYGI